jgi:hypothetical protein
MKHLNPELERLEQRVAPCLATLCFGWCGGAAEEDHPEEKHSNDNGSDDSNGSGSSESGSKSSKSKSHESHSS